MKIRPNGLHWWFGISNEKDVNGRLIVWPKWHVVHCWSEKREGYATGAHFENTMNQREMVDGVWGEEIIPPKIP